MSFEYDYEGDCEGGTCPSCQDNCLQWEETPFYATDQAQAYRLHCHCGYEETWTDMFFLDTQDLIENLWFIRLMEKQS